MALSCRLKQHFVRASKYYCKEGKSHESTVTHRHPCPRRWCASEKACRMNSVNPAGQLAPHRLHECHAFPRSHREIRAVNGGGIILSESAVDKARVRVRPMNWTLYRRATTSDESE